MATTSGRCGVGESFNDSFAVGQVAGFSLDQVIGGWQEGLRAPTRATATCCRSRRTSGTRGDPGRRHRGGDTLVFVSTSSRPRP